VSLFDAVPCPIKRNLSRDKEYSCSGQSIVCGIFDMGLHNISGIGSTSQVISCHYICISVYFL
jgi:hypothetical protein